MIEVVTIYEQIEENFQIKFARMIQDGFQVVNSGFTRVDGWWCIGIKRGE